MRSSGASAVDGLPALVFLAGIEIVPALPRRQIHRPRARLVLRDRGDQEGGAEHVFVVHAPDVLVRREIHDEAAHHGAIARVGVGGDGVDVGHQPVAQPVVQRERVVDLRAGLGDFENFAVAQFAMGCGRSARRRRTRTSGCKARSIPPAPPAWGCRHSGLPSCSRRYRSSSSGCRTCEKFTPAEIWSRMSDQREVMSPLQTAAP